MRKPWSPLAYLSAVISCCSACQVYDSSLTQVPEDSSTCVPETEVCNDKDDDCDGVTDEAAAVRVACEKQLVHADTLCKDGLCVTTACRGQYHSCDGIPQNGCEYPCDCSEECSDDAGSDLDGG